MFFIHQLFIALQESRFGGAVHEGAGARLYQVQSAYLKYKYIFSSFRLSSDPDFFRDEDPTFFSGSGWEKMRIRP